MSKLETFHDLDVQTAVDAALFGVRMQIDKIPGELVAKEAYGWRADEGDFDAVDNVYVVRTGSRYDGSSLESKCNTLINKISDAPNPFTEGRHAGFSAEVILYGMATDRARPSTEQGDIAIRFAPERSRGEINLITNHIHGPGQAFDKRRIDLGDVYANRYLGAAHHFRTGKLVRQAYEQWQQDLEAAEKHYISR